MQIYNKRHVYGAFIILVLLGIISGLIIAKQLFLVEKDTEDARFNGARAYRDIEKQLSFGPRTPGSVGHKKTIQWITDELKNNHWLVSLQQTEYAGHSITNVIGKKEFHHNQEAQWIIIGAHYDTRLKADRDKDPTKTVQPVPGANDGASGVAVLLELARILPDSLNTNIWLVFFDVEDNGRLEGWDWILGSRTFVAELEGNPSAAIIVDMVGDKELNLYIEEKSNANLVNSIWKTAAEAGFQQFISRKKHTLIDDHVPFLEAGIPAVDIIDFDYPYWHTTSDTLDKISAESLEAVGETLLIWLTNQTGRKD